MFRRMSRLSRLSIVVAIILLSGGSATSNAQGAGRRTAQMPLTLDLIGFR